MSVCVRVCLPEMNGASSVWREWPNKRLRLFSYFSGMSQTCLQLCIRTDRTHLASIHKQVKRSFQTRGTRKAGGERIGSFLFAGTGNCSAAFTYTPGLDNVSKNINSSQTLPAIWCKTAQISQMSPLSLSRPGSKQTCQTCFPAAAPAEHTRGHRMTGNLVSVWTRVDEHMPVISS